MEQAIFVEGEADRRFDTGDFLEFYGRGNDGAPDSLLYAEDRDAVHRPPLHTAQPHPYYSLFNDTTAYFLTWQPDGKPGKRMAAYTDTASAGLTPEPYHWADELRLFTDDYPGWPHGLTNKVEVSQYESGEGYTGVIQPKDKPYSNAFYLTNPFRNGPAPQLDLLLVGRGFTNHRVECFAGPTPANSRLIDTLRFAPFDNARSQQTLTWNDISPNEQLAVSTVSRGESTSTDAYSVSYIRLRYPQKFSLHGEAKQHMRLAPNPAGRSLLNLTGVVPGTRFWDISDPAAPIQLGAATTSPGEIHLVVRATSTARTILAASEPKTVAGIRPVTFTNWETRKPTYLIVSHEALMQPISQSAGTTNAVRDYAAYRASAAGGGHDTLTVTMQQLIDQYSYGERHPLAIRRFARQMLRQSGNALQYLLLLGRSRSTPGIRRNPQQATLDMVMTAGFPGSDVVFTEGLNEDEPNIPAIPTGRINAGTPQEVLDYLNKVTEYERQSDAAWRKNLLHLSGGQAPGELVLFRQLVDAYGQQAAAHSLGARVTTISKATDKSTEQINVAKPVNEGVGLMTFFGHSGLDITDIDIGFCSNDALGYRNEARYPVLLVNGCAIGNFFFGRPTLATDWVLTPNRGAIAAIAHSHSGYADLLHQYSSAVYTLLTDSTQLHKSIGQLQQETIRRVLAQTSDGRTAANCQQMVLQGDPAIRLFPFQTPDYVLTAGGLTIQSTDQQPLTTSSDSVQIRAIVQNVGQYWRGPLPVRVRRFINGLELGSVNLTLPHSVAYRDTLTLTLPNEQGANGQHQFAVTINPVGTPATMTETNHTNNQAIAEVLIGSFVYAPDSASAALPEGQIRLAKALPTDIRQGDVVAIPVEFTNLSRQPFRDSLVVQQTIYSGGLSNPQTSQWRVKALLRHDTLRVTTRIATKELPGINRLILTINPRLQPEYSFLNNTLDLLLPVQPDQFGPLLEVAFDGARITEGSVVSAQPLLDVLVADENRSLIRRDTTGLDLNLQRPGPNAPFERLSWRSATSQLTQMDNVFRLRYPLPRLTEGMYRLLVTARDAVGNSAVPYQVGFRVVQEKQLASLTVYPNPFRDQTLFSFSLAGNRAPDTATITITNLNGQVVRHLNKAARIGLNDWVWDSLSSTGEPLPAGVYLYKLTVADNVDWPVAAGVQQSGRVLLTR
ncbi:hypothetical protein GCM10027190_43500 [Spirosoma areae]